MNTSILTIDPGTRYWGVSVFHGRDLITCMIKNLSTKDSSRNRLQVVRKTFLTLCKKHAPHVLIIEKPFEFWEDQSEYLKEIIREIKRLSKKWRIHVIEFSPKTVGKVTCQDERATKDQKAQSIAQSYPELKDYFDHGQKCNNKYWGRMVDSMALGICYLKRLEKH